MRTVELGITVEVGVRKGEHIQQEELNELVRNFLRSLKSFKGFKVLFGKAAYDQMHLIPDFNHNIFNMCEESKKYDVYRHLSSSIIVAVPGDSIEVLKYRKIEWHEYKSLIFAIHSTSIGTMLENSQEPKYLGSTELNSGEVLDEEKESQISLFD